MPLELLLRPLIYAGLVALVFVPLERLAPLREPRRGGVRTDALFATVGAVLSQLAVYAVGGVLLALAERLDGAPLRATPGWIALPVSLLVFELGGYAYHRAAHRVGWLSRLHAVHHSAPHMDWLAGFRQHPLEVALMTGAQNLPLVLLGLPLETHVLLVVLLRLNTLWVHSNVRAPRWLEPWLATPVFHQRHHARDQEPANFATLFPWLDRLFGTHRHDAVQQFGLEGDERGFLALLLCRRR